MNGELEVVRTLEGRSTRLHTTSAGRRLVWHRWGNGPAVVLIHGGYGSWTHWVRTISPLAARYTVLAVDLPGMGDSDEPGGVSTLETLAESVASGLRTLTATSTQYHLVGFSFGGCVSGVLAICDEARIRSVTLVAPGRLPQLRPPVELQPWRHLPTADAQAVVHRANLAALMISNPTAIDDLAIYLQAENVRRGRLRSREVTPEPVLARLLPDVVAPVGVIYGELDATVYPYLHRREEQLRTLIPNVEFRVVPSAGHWVQYERPDEFNAILIDLLGGYAGGE